MVARLDPIKDHDTVLRALPLIRESYPHATLALAGDGTRRKELEELACSLGIRSAVEFLGDVQDVYEFLGTLDVFLYATTEREGLGSVVAEAMAAGVPTVATDLSMLREWDPSGTHVRWVPPADEQAMGKATVQLLEKPGKRRQLSENGHRRAEENFTASRFVKDYHE